MNVELRHLRYFVAVAEEASFTAAAVRVHVAQQVLSTQIRQLEDVVGTRLLNRTSRGVTLTPAGAAFLTTARETLAALDRGVAAARNAARAVNGKLMVGVGPGCENETRTRLLTDFERAYPAPPPGRRRRADHRRHRADRRRLVRARGSRARHQPLPRVRGEVPRPLGLRAGPRRKLAGPDSSRDDLRAVRSSSWCECRE
jgi:DNA-binding transcriptional LysR family regulator